MVQPKRVLITGAAGFLGSHLCDRFIAEGFHVIAMDNLITGDLKISNIFSSTNVLNFIITMFRNLFLFRATSITFYISHRLQARSII